MKRIDETAYLRVVPIKQAVERDLLALPGVTGVGVGYKQVGGEETSDMAILVFVRHKGEFAPADEIPTTIQGVPTDVIEGEFKPLITDSLPAVDTKRYDPLVGGCSGAPAREDYAGTVGVLVTDKATGAQRMLSNWHVFCGDPGWDSPGVDHRITQPAIRDGGSVTTDVIGNVVKGVVGQVVIPWGYDLYVDCALCDLSGGRAAANSINRIGTLRGSATPIVGELVRKCGRTTSSTYGVVADTNFTGTFNYPGIGPVTMYYQYRITAPDPTMPPFSQPGDSGSIVVDTEWNGVGLVFGSGTAGASQYSVANPLYMVLQALNISLVTSSTEECA